MRVFRDLRTLLVLVTVLCLAASGVAVAQLQTGDIYGKVVDEKGATLPGATLTLTGTSGGQQIAQSDESGLFRFIGLYPGDYSIKAELSGFSAVEHTGIGVRVGGKAQVELTLSSELKETIVVTASRAPDAVLDTMVVTASRKISQV